MVNMPVAILIEFFGSGFLCFIFYYYKVIYLSLYYSHLSPADFAAEFKKTVAAHNRAADRARAQESDFAAGLANAFFIGHTKYSLQEFISFKHSADKPYFFGIKNFCLTAL